MISNLHLRRDTIIISKENDSKTYMEECTIRGIFHKEEDAVDSVHTAHQQGFSLKRLRRIAQQFVEMDWIGNNEFNMFIDEVSTLPTKREETVKEVTEDDTSNSENDLDNLRVEEEHFDLDEYKSTLTKSQRRAYTEISDTLTSRKQLLTAVIWEA